MNLTASQSLKVDKILTHKVWGFLIFLYLMWLMFFCTFMLGKYPQTWIENGVGVLSDFMRNQLTEGALKDLLVDGIVSGVGSVIVFLPNILILFLFISVFEESGYMARAAYIMDGFMHKIGLHGQSFLPLVMGFGCNVPAILSTQTITRRNDRLLTMLINPFMSCSARLPVYILLVGAFFPENPVRILILIYFTGIVVAIGVALLMKKFLFPPEPNAEAMQHVLAPYRIPSVRSMLAYMWEKTLQYLRKIGGVVLVAVIIIWALNYFPKNIEYSKDYDALIAQTEASYNVNKAELTAEKLAERDAKIHAIGVEKQAEHQLNSYLGRIGQFVEPVMRPLGFDWKISIALLSGLPAKEFVVSTLGVIYQVEDGTEHSSALIKRLRNETYTTGEQTGQKVFNKAVALSLLMFVLLYFPCVASVAAIRKESGSWSWAIFAIFYTTGLAWLLSFFTYRIALFFI